MNTMVIRLLSLTIFRAVLITALLGYQLLALIFPFPLLPFEKLVWVMGGVTLFNIVYMMMLVKGVRFKQDVNYIFFQFTLDSLAISVLIVFTGGIESSLKFAYLIFILLSALFLERIAIYAQTVMSLAFYYFSLNFTEFLFNDGFKWGFDVQFTGRVSQATLIQFVICSITALLSGYMQVTYRTGRQALEEKEQHIRGLRAVRRKIVETLPSGLIICNDHGAVNFINQVGLSLLNLEPGPNDEPLADPSFNAWSFFGIAPDLTRDGLHEHYLSRTERQITLDGVRKIIGISYTPMELESGDSGFMLVFQDLTKIKLLEAHRSLDDRMTAIGKVAAGVAHEIRNPLAAVSGSVQVLKEMVPEDEEAQDLADIVTRETSRLNEIISQFLAYAKPGPPAAFHPLSLSKVINEFYSLTQNDTMLKARKIKLELGNERGTMILGDEGKFYQVLWNLVRNAAAASEESALIIIGCFGRGEEVVFFVEDFGMGMTEDQLSDLFTPFQSFSKGGTGLGMSLVYDIIKAHHGTIDVRSKVGEGTRIEIKIARYKE